MRNDNSVNDKGICSTAGTALQVKTQSQPAAGRNGPMDYKVARRYDAFAFGLAKELAGPSSRSVRVMLTHLHHKWPRRPAKQHTNAVSCLCVGATLLVCVHGFSGVSLHPSLVFSNSLRPLWNSST
jgi:hypothetical protein